VGSGAVSSAEPLIDRLRRAVLGRYDVYAELGQGGMASVFLALDLALERKVAIKVLSPALAGSPDNVERFKREARIAAALNHPHIIGILAVGDDPDLAYFVMKFVEGRSLDSVIRDDGPQPVPFVQSVIASAGRALHHAHTRGVIHRDVKPANIMLDQDGWLVVTDFGIAKQGDVKALTATGSLIGTPHYMSPEQFHGKPIVPAADQYALGVVAYELLTGAQPYVGDTVAEVMRGHLFDAVPDIRTARPDVPADVAACISRMLAKEPAERFASLEDAVAAFGAITPTQEQQVRTQIIELAKSGVRQQPQIQVPQSPVPAARTRKAPQAPPAHAAQLAATTPVQLPARRSKAPLFVALALLVAAGGATAVLKPELLGLGGDAARAVAPGATPAARSKAAATRAPADRPRQSAAVRDSIARAVAQARADSITRTMALARIDSLARVDSLRRAAAARLRGANRPDARPGAAIIRARKGARRPPTTTTPP
jgi:hypothetical protein